MQDEVSPSEGEDNTLSYQYGWLKWNENSKTSSSKRGEDHQLPHLQNSLSFSVVWPQNCIAQANGTSTPRHHHLHRPLLKALAINQLNVWNLVLISLKGPLHINIKPHRSWL